MESTPLAPHVVQFYSITWFLDDRGIVQQTLEDQMDSGIALFTETAKAHNLAVYFS